MKEFKDYIIKEYDEVDGDDLLVTENDVFEIIDFLESYYDEEDDQTGLMYLELLDEVISSGVTSETLNVIYHTLNELLVDGEIDDDDDDEEELEEGKLKKKTNVALKMTRRKSYRKNKAKLKLKGRRYRKTPGFKKWKKRSKIRAKSGKTASGKRQSTFIK